MILRRIELRSFRQFVAADIEFDEGITMILGANGSGKTTILEALKYAFYGVCRGKMEDLPNMHHGGKMSVAVEFDLGNFRYRCERGKSDASIQKQNVDGWEKVAFSLSGVKEYSAKLLGLTAEQFSSSYFTEQKEIEFLKFAKEKQQQQIAQMLGIEVLATASRTAKEKARACDIALEQMSSMLERREALEADLVARQESKAACEQELAGAKKLLKEIESLVEKLTPEKERAAEWLSLDARTKHRADVGRQLQDDVRQFEAEVKAAEAAVNERSELEPFEKSYRELCKKQEEMDAQRRLLSDKERWILARDTKVADIAESELRLDPEVDQRAAHLDALLAAAMKSREESAVKLEHASAQWRDEKTTTQNLQHLLERDIAAAREELSVVEEAEAKGICPTCGQAMPDGHAPKSAALQASLTKFHAELAAAEVKLKTLEAEPKGLLSAREFSAKVQAECEKLVAELSQAKSEVAASRTIKEKIYADKSAIAELQKKIDTAATSFDQAAFDVLGSQIADIEPKRNRWLALEEAAERLRVSIRRRNDKAEQFETEKASQLKDRQRMEEIGLSAESAARIQSEFSEARSSLPHVRRRVDDCDATVQTASAAIADVEQRLIRWQENSTRIEVHKHDRDLYREIGEGMADLRTKLNAEIGPTLASFAADALSQITDNRYTRVSIDESFRATLMDGENRKNVISGGEEDVLALSLRIALSRYVQEKSGLPLSLLVLDEVFGSLDAERKLNVLELFDGLRGIFPQIILISHVDGLTEHADRVLRVTYDSGTKESSVAEFINDVTISL
ncbi:MAG: SMC family ATPase [Armatimonadota bacterium]|nr:SMC family ATPase [Armatimonadota bacterium]